MQNANKKISFTPFTSGRLEVDVRILSALNLQNLDNLLLLGIIILLLISLIIIG